MRCVKMPFEASVRRGWRVWLGVRGLGSIPELDCEDLPRSQIPQQLCGDAGLEYEKLGLDCRLHRVSPFSTDVRGCT